MPGRALAPLMRHRICFASQLIHIKAVFRARHTIASLQLFEWANMQLSERWSRGKTEWNILTSYQRFESAVAFTLNLIIALIILVALYRLFAEVVIER